MGFSWFNFGLLVAQDCFFFNCTKLFRSVGKNVMSMCQKFSIFPDISTIKSANWNRFIQLTLFHSLLAISSKVCTFNAFSFFNPTSLFRHRSQIKKNEDGRFHLWKRQLIRRCFQGRGKQRDRVICHSKLPHSKKELDAHFFWKG